MFEFRIVARFFLALFILIFPPLAAFAQSTASTVVDLHPVVSSDTIWQAIAGVAVGIVGWLLTKIGALLKIKIDDSVRAYVSDIAVKGVLQAQAKFGSLPMKVDVGSPFIAEAANFLVAHAPAGLKWFGIDPNGDAVKNMVSARTQELLNKAVPPALLSPAAAAITPAAPIAAN